MIWGKKKQALTGPAVGKGIGGSSQNSQTFQDLLGHAESFHNGCPRETETQEAILKFKEAISKVVIDYTSHVQSCHLATSIRLARPDRHLTT